MSDHDPTLEADVFARDCSSRSTLQTVTGRWGTLVLIALRESNYRFSALRRRVDGVSERMLSQTLQNLERDGMIVRTVLEAIPPKVEYDLTPLGRQVADQLQGLIDLLQGHMPTVRDAQAEYDGRRGTSA
ncbi:MULTISPECIES: winged helix-turn-helix transcriptional regulator [Gordonia]|jgi:DNA-binding HxlR family transcriptional regulator|uniref:HxlR family transcriptional regulator n=2 Tax=Gordonia alkanivorans TaxID=84096 RepID=W9DA87_9ACTN|nr:MULTISPECIES: helix-turn-helix domain-containing protein [Gordonia]AZZ81691.1 transcriptional regulator [Gordonia alkanivorans]ETA05244.1 HxlR family transcriptional regulator [Gordonia alkanivorans CGMCC 6845]MDH3007851.1 helix-turn-helix domain-containing protein [Gordonia alkanivorans]MDH3011925.1 helix-turn-helix domain-containing protein [Gordonia alkanivorans]MDH3016788.1 helix-turn-helix domain-containing protein [Gordonia alkanivorans]